MISKKTLGIVGMLLFVAVFVVACGGTPTTEEPVVEEPIVEEPATQEPAEPEGPTELRMAMTLSQTIDSAWDYTVVDSYKRLQALSPHGLTLHDVVWTEGIWGDDVTVVLREYAETGLYDIIWCNTTCSDQVKAVAPDYPEILFVYVGSGNEGLGGNTFWVYKRIHEPAYLMGMLAGYMTNTNQIGTVGTFAFDDVNDVINAFVQGAKDVNPDITSTVTFIESWYDPAKALEAGNAQVAAGADHILQLAEGFDACAGDVFCYGPYGDYNYIAPDNVLTSTLSAWDPDILWIIDEWWEHKTTGAAYDGNTEPKWFPMAEGAADLAPFHGLEAKIPTEAYDAVMAKKAEIMAGDFVVELNVETPVSD
jgi:basic membrane lipoprotein Med (substrate-binding protein (PBP1-ABC) superfamily)